MHQSINLTKSYVIKRSRNILQLLLAKALIICNSEAPRTVKRNSDVSVGVETRLRAKWSGVLIIL